MNNLPIPRGLLALLPSPEWILPPRAEARRERQWRRNAYVKPIVVVESGELMKSCCCVAVRVDRGSAGPQDANRIWITSTFGHDRVFHANATIWTNVHCCLMLLASV